MFGSTIVQHSRRLPKESERVTVIIPARYESYIRLLLAVWLVAWGAMETLLIVNLIDQVRDATPRSTPSVTVLAVLLTTFTAAGLFMAWRLLWVSRGREILELTREQLRLRREPGTHASEEYSRPNIRNLHIGSYSADHIYPSWGRRFLGKEEAFIAFDYEGKTHEIARGIERREAEYVLDLIRGSSLKA